MKRITKFLQIAMALSYKLKIKRGTHMLNKFIFIVNIILTSILFLLPISVKSDENHSHSEMMTHHNKKSDSPVAKIPKSTIKLSVQNISDFDHKNSVHITLKKIKDGSPITLNDLKEVHTQKIHLLIIDDELQDYSHIHPIATAVPGVYQFEWQPKKEAHYRIFADLFPVALNAEEYVVADLSSENRKTKLKYSKIDRNVSFESVIDGYNFKLSFDKPILQVGKASVGTISVTDQKGNPVKDLEPLMGAFAHIVGFNEDLNSVIHIHPMGEEPSKLTDRGGPLLKFHIEPEKSGFIKLFAQVKINGKEVFAPFGIMVQP